LFEPWRPGKEQRMKQDHRTALKLAVAALALAVAVPAVAQAQATPGQAAPDAPAPGGPAMPFMRGWHAHGRLSLLAAAAEVTGLSPTELRAELAAGKTLAQVAEAEGKTADDVVAAARRTLETHLDQAVASGRLSAERAEAKLKAFDAAAPEAVESATAGRLRPFMGQGDCPGMKGGTDGRPADPASRGLWFSRLRGGSGDA
jgi:hypothetical protein